MLDDITNGVVSTANSLSNPVTLNLTGDASGSVSFDGSTSPVDFSFITVSFSSRAGVATDVIVREETENRDYFPTFVRGTASGEDSEQKLKTDSGAFKYNPGTDTLSVTNLDVSGTMDGTITNAESADVATKVNIIAANQAPNNVVSVILGSGLDTGEQELRRDSNLTFDVLSNTLILSRAVASGIVTANDFNSTSDRKLKTNIERIPDPIEKVLKIDGVNFNWVDDGRPSIGVIADNIEEVLPELVSDSDPKTVNYNGLIGLLIEVVKEQQNQIDSIKERLSQLE
jgi:hypothetical protein